MKIVVDKMPQSPKECFYAHRLKSGEPTCWCVTGDSDWTTDMCSLGFGQKCPYLTEMRGESNESEK